MHLIEIVENSKTPWNASSSVRSIGFIMQYSLPSHQGYFSNKLFHFIHLITQMYTQLKTTSFVFVNTKNSLRIGIDIIVDLREYYED